MPVTDYDLGVLPNEAEDPGVTKGDFARGVGAATADVGSNLAGMSRYFFEQAQQKQGADLSQGLQQIFNIGADTLRDGIHPEAKKLATAAVTSPEFWEHPLLASALKTANMVPAMAALAIPGGLFTDTVAASMAAAAGGAAINAGSGVDEFYKKLDEMPDEELQNQSPKYAAMREVMDERTARSKFAKQAMGWAPAINAVLGAGAAAIGPAGTAARRLAGGAGNVVGGAEQGAIGAGALGATEGAVGNAAQAGTADYLSQQTDIEANFQKDLDRARVANAAIEGGAFGGLTGGLVGAVLHGKAPAPEATDTATAKLDTADKTAPVATADVASPQQGVGRASATPVSPVDTAQVGNPQSSPGRSDTGYGKTKKGKKGAKVDATPATAPDAAQAAAIDATNPAGTGAAPDVNAALARLTGQPAAEPVPAQVTPQPAPQPEPKPVPPEVAQASQNLAQGQPADTGLNAPETPATLQAQQGQIGTGNRKAVMYPKGTTPGAQKPGTSRINTPRGVVDYDPTQLTAKQVIGAIAQGKENEILGLGPFSKPEIMQRMAAGEKPVAVTERTPQGVEVKAALGTEQTAPTQLHNLETNKTPGNVVGLENPQDTVAARKPQILRNLNEVAETAPLDNATIKKNLGPEAKPVDENGNEVRGGKRYSDKEKEALGERLTKQKEIYERNAPPETGEENYLTDPAHRNAVIARARAIIKEATDEGVKIQKVLKRSAKGNSASDEPSTQLLTAANTLVKAAEKSKTGQGKKITEAAARFKDDENHIRAGHSADVLERRRVEGDQAMNRRVVDESRTEEGGAGSTQPSAAARVADNSQERVVKGKDGTEQKVTGAKAANAGRVLSAEEKAAIAERMGLGTKGKPDKPPTKNNGDALVNRNPTERQKKAGNYKKGHRRIEGLDYSIENPRGAMRRGVDEHGKAWEVKMPADYGYLRGTKGADGDHIDAYDLKSGKKHFVIDQLDHKTGEFDEHKVMLRAKDEAHARDTYKSAFSDNVDRLGHIHEVTTPELKDWMASGDAKDKSHLEHVVGEEDRTFTPPDTKTVSDHLTSADGERIKAERSDHLINELERFDFSKLHGVGPTLAKFFHSRFKKLADDTNAMFHVVSPENMQKMWGNEDPNQTPIGMHQIDANGNSHVIVSSNIKDDGLARGSLAHVVLHETAHAFTVREINRSPAARKLIEKLMTHADHWISDHQDAVEKAIGLDKVSYGFTNAKEFIAEAYSNADFQTVLTQIPVTDPWLRDYLGLNTRSMSLWDVFRGFVKKQIEKITGTMPQFDSVLDGIMKVGEHLEREHREEFIGKGRRYGENGYEGAHAFVKGNSDALMKQGTDAVKKLLEHPRLNEMEHGPVALKLRTFDNIAQLADHYFGENNPVRKITNAIEKMRVTAENIFQKATPLISTLVKLRAKDAEGFREFSSLLHDATVANVHPDVPLTDAKNAHLGKARVVGSAVWAKAQHGDLARRYRALSPELQEAWHSTTKYFRDQQNAMSLGIIENRILKTLGVDDAALARRIHEGTATDADRASVGEDMFSTIEEAGELSKIEGPYVPLMRRGDHVVKGDYKVTSPGNAKVIGPHEFEFADEKAATDYARNSTLAATIKKVWVDEATGELHRGDATKVSAKDLDSVPRYRVSVQGRHVEFVEGRAAAERRAQQLAKSGEIDVHKVVPRAYEVGGRQGTELSASLQRLVSKLEKSEAYKQSTPTQQAGLRQAVEEAAAASHGSTRITSKALPRRGVEGYSEDLVKNTGDYGESSSRYLAKLEHMPAVEAGMKAMEERLKADHSKTNQYGRTTIRNEVLRRVNGDNGFNQGGKFAPTVKRLMAASFIDKLASPAYSVINAMQPGMVTMPYLAGRHGVGRAAVALGRAYSDISAGKIIRQGLKETGRRLKGSGAPDDFITNAKASLKDAGERKMLDFMVEHGVVDPSAGMEVRAMTKDYTGLGGKADAALGYLDGVTREMPRAIEAINRMTTALAAYRLEKSKGASHDKAVQYAQDAVNNTQFNYSPTNSAPFMNHPLAKMAFQFKKYGQGIYQLIGGQIGKFYRNASPGDRKEAAKTLISMAATHMAMAGALGLPTEPFKYLVMASGLVGGPQWGDVEDKIRKVAADVLGKTGGEVFTRGLPRLLNIDLSRVGLDSVTSFGEPRSQKEGDVKSWLFDTVAGPVASLGLDYGKAIGNISRGEFEKAAENMIPIKAASDSLRAYRQLTEGKKSASGKQTSAPYSFGEAALRAAGFGTGREAEEGAANSMYYRQSQEAKDARGGLVNAWTGAKPTEKGGAMAAITKWNMSHSDDKITMKELTNKVKRDTSDARKSVRGITPNKHTKRILEESPYNG